MNMGTKSATYSSTGRPWPPEQKPLLGLNQFLDAIGGRQPRLVDSFSDPAKVLHWLGLATGITLSLGVAFARAMPATLAAMVAACAIATLALLQALRAGRKQQRAPHFAMQDIVLATLVPAVLASAFELPETSLLALGAIGLGGYLVFARLACLVEGCCHGRPSTIGARHFASGPHDLLEGARLFPVPLMEAAWVLAVTAGTIVLTLRSTHEGAAAWFWLLGYCGGRFVFDGIRGDILFRAAGLSPAQWWACAIVGARLFQDAFTAAPSNWLAVAGASVALVGAGVSAGVWQSRERRAVVALDEVTDWQWLNADLDREADAESGRGAVVRFSPGGRWELRLSMDAADEGLQRRSYTVRSISGDMSALDARALTGLILQRLPAHRLLRVWQCDHGSLHLWVAVNVSGTPGSTPADPPITVLLRAQAFAISSYDRPVWNQCEPETLEEPHSPPPTIAKTSPGTWYFQDGVGERIEA